MSNLWKPKPARRSEIDTRARELAYLGDASKIRSALIYQYGREIALPPLPSLRAIVERRANAIIELRERTERRLEKA